MKCKKMPFLPQVLDFIANSNSSVDGLKAAVKNVVAQLKKQGLLSGETVGQIFNSVSNKLNGQSDESTKADRQKVTAFIDYIYIGVCVSKIYYRLLNLCVVINRWHSGSVV